MLARIRNLIHTAGSYGCSLGQHGQSQQNFWAFGRARSVHHIWAQTERDAAHQKHEITRKVSRSVSLPRPPNLPLLRAVWSLLVGIWGLLKGNWGVLVCEVPILRRLSKAQRLDVKSYRNLFRALQALNYLSFVISWCPVLGILA